MAMTLDQLFSDVEKHLPGKHDQKDHGHSQGGKGQDVQSGPAEPSEDKKDALEALAAHHIYRVRGPDKSTTRTLRNGKKKTKKTITYRYYDSITKKEIKNDDRIAIWNKKAGPPAATKVYINPDPNGHMVSIWVDAKDRDHRTYTKTHDKESSAEKYQRLKDFNKALPKMRKQVREDLKSENARTRELAAVTLLIDRTAFRLGGLRDTKAEVKAYGAATLLNGNVKVNGSKLVFDFIGKKGVRIKKTMRDAELAEEIKKRKTTAYSKPLWNIKPNMVARYIKRISGKKFSAKDYRTWNATNMAWSWIKRRKGPASTEQEFGKWQKEVATRVSKHLGNTPGVVVSNYIDPHAWDPWRKLDWGPFIPKKLRGDD